MKKNDNYLEKLEQKRRAIQKTSNALETEFESAMQFYEAVPQDSKLVQDMIEYYDNRRKNILNDLRRTEMLIENYEYLHKN